jgi:serine/threonine protein kinase
MPVEMSSPANEPERRGPSDLTGQMVGQYRLVRKLGEGGMGVVYEGVHERLGQRVAVKLLHRKLDQDGMILQRFFNEARAISIVQHPGLVRIHDYRQLDDGTAYLVMEYLEGESLEERLLALHKRGDRLPIETVVTVGEQIAQALAAAHGHGIVHCDLKPENVHLAPDPAVPGGERVKVLDFGIAKFLSETGGKKTTVGLVLGTPKYMSPEQCEGRDKVDHQVDVYALGVILYEALAGKPPFDAESGAALLRQHMIRPPPPLRDQAPHVPPALHELVHEMLAKEGEKRPTMAQVAERLRGASTAGRSPLRRRWPLLVAAALLTCAAAATALLLRPARPVSPPPLAERPGVRGEPARPAPIRPPAPPPPAVQPPPPVDKKAQVRPARERKGAARKKDPGKTGLELPQGWKPL